MVRQGLFTDGISRSPFFEVGETGGRSRMGPQAARRKSPAAARRSRVRGPRSRSVAFGFVSAPPRSMHLLPQKRNGRSTYPFGLVAFPRCPVGRIRAAAHVALRPCCRVRPQLSRVGRVIDPTSFALLDSTFRIRASSPRPATTYQQNALMGESFIENVSGSLTFPEPQL